MARIVDKEQKRRDIALACKDMVLQNTLNSSTVSSLAKEAGVGKGTIYEYFQNKEEIVFEIVTIISEARREVMAKKISEAKTTKEKLKRFSEFFYSAEDVQLRNIYKEFTSISLINPTQEMIQFQTQHLISYYDWFIDVLQEGIDSGEVRPEVMDLAKGLFVVGKGLFIISSTTTLIDDLKTEFEKFLDTLFALLEVK